MTLLDELPFGVKVPASSTSSGWMTPAKMWPRQAPAALELHQASAQSCGHHGAMENDRAISRPRRDEARSDGEATFAAAPGSDPTGLLATKGLACWRGSRVLFQRLDLQIDRGSVTWLRGTNGSGKTSLMRILAGLSHADEGEVTWEGTPLARTGASARRQVIYIGHANALKDDLTLVEALAFLATLNQMDDAVPRARRALDRLGLSACRNAFVRTLSQGQRRRGALARLALDDQARTWILDEPFDALDTHGVRLLSDLIESHSARGGATLLTSHQPIQLADLREIDLEVWRVA